MGESAFFIGLIHSSILFYEVVLFIFPGGPKAEFRVI